jgi:hypothetical protein
MNFLESLGESPVAEWILYTDYGFYITLAGHAVGMAVVVGMVYMLAARTLGFAQGVPLRIFDKMVTIAWLGFALNAITGVMLFTANGVNLVQNPSFIVKLILIAIGGVVASLQWRNLNANPEVMEGSVAASSQARIMAVASLVLWTGAIVAGRIIGYTANY